MHILFKYEILYVRS